jgi:Mce-associated membrane protein
LAVSAGVIRVLRRLSSRRSDRRSRGATEDYDLAAKQPNSSAAALHVVGVDEDGDALVEVASGGEQRAGPHDEPTAATHLGADDVALDGEPEEGSKSDDSDSAWLGSRRTVTAFGWAIALCTAAAAALGGVIGYLEYQTHVLRVTAEHDNMFIEAGRQAALNLTTISYTDVDRDVARVLDSATGSFHDDFQNRSGPFIAVVKQAQSTSRGTITEAGLSSVDGDQAQVIVAVSVTTTIAGQSNDQQPRGWRMRLNVQKVGNTAKVSDVQFVP